MCPNNFGTDCVGRQPLQYTPAWSRNYCATYAPNQFTAASASYDPLNFNYSIYGNDIDLTSDYSFTGGGYGPMGAYGGYGGYTYDPDMMYQQMDKWTDYMFDRNVKYTEKSRANDMRINGPLEAAQYAADALREKIIKDDQPQVAVAFNKYKAALVKLYPEYANLDDKALSAKAMELYKQRNGIGLKDDIRANSPNIFMQKFLNGATFGLAFRGSAEQTISEISGNPISHDDKIKGAIGTTAGVAASATVGFQVLKHSPKILNVAVRNPIASLILVGASVLGISSFFGSKS